MLPSWVWEYKLVILFYLAIVLFIYIKRSKFEFQAKVIALYRTNFGLKMIERVGGRHSEVIKLIGYWGIGIGFLGMGFIVYMLFKGMYDLLFVPGAPPVISPVLPGVPIPGSPVFVPFWYGIIALFVVVVVHEFSHGIVARAHKVRVTSTGIVFFGPIIGAFVEPDEKQVEKKSDVVKYSIFAAGPWSNIILAALVLAIAAWVMGPITGAIAKPIGVTFTSVEEGFPAQLAGLETGVVYTFVNGQNITEISDFEASLKNVSVGQTIELGNLEKMYLVTTTSRNETPEKAVIGVNVKTAFTNEDKWWLQAILWFNGLIAWIFILSLGLGLANLLPLGPVDGGRMIKEALENTWGKDKGAKFWMKLTFFVIIFLLILVFVPIIKAVFFK